MTLHIEQKGGEEIVRKLTPDVYKPPVQDLLRSAGEFTVREASANEMRDVGAIASSIGADVSDMQVRIFASHPGAVAAEFGRKVGTPQPPESALEGWAGRHGLSDAVFVIARAIRQRGIVGRFFLRRAVERLQQSELSPLLQRAAADIETRWSRK